MEGGRGAFVYIDSSDNSNPLRGGFGELDFCLGGKLLYFELLFL